MNSQKNESCMLDLLFVIDRVETSQSLMQSIESIERSASSCFGKANYEILVHAQPISTFTKYKQLHFVTTADLEARIYSEHYRYVMKMVAGTLLDDTTFVELKNILQDSQRSELPSLILLREGNYKYKLNKYLTRSLGQVLTLESETFLWVGATPFFVSRATIKRLSSVTVLNNTDPIQFLKTLTNSNTFCTLESRVFTQEKHEDKYFGEQHLFQMEWYLDFVLELYSFSVNFTPKTPLVLQRIFVYLIGQKFNANYGRRNKNALTEDQLLEFLRICKQLLKKVDVNVIESTLRSNVQNMKAVSHVLFSLKLDGTKTEKVDEVTGELEVSGCIAERVSESRIVIQSMNAHEDGITIKGHIRTFRLSEYLTFYAHCNKEKYLLSDTYSYSETSFFGKQFHRFPTFTLKIPNDKLKKKSNIEFYACVNNSIHEHQLGVFFQGEHAKLSDLESSYWRTPHAVLFAKGQRISIKRNSFVNFMISECKFQSRLLFSKDRVRRSAAMLRTLFFITRPFFARKRHWLYYDRVVRAGDNAEYAYTFASGQKDGIRKYYVLNSGATDAQRFIEENKTFLPHKSLKQRLLFLNSEKVFGSFHKPASKNSFSWNEKYFRDLFNYEFIYLNHGLVLDRLDHVLNQTALNADLLCVVSTKEKQALMKPTYGYDSAAVKVTGFARYDGLVSCAAKKILLAPTWRYYLNKPQIDDIASPKNEDFKESQYYKVFDSLINNDKLLDFLTLRDFSLIFLLHPNVSPHASDFVSPSPNVHVVSPTQDISYEKLLRESAVMITDFSGVQYDFGFMEKPVIYYHHPDLPPHYPSDEFSYPLDGFGKVEIEEDGVVNTLLSIINNDCVMEEKYRNRVERFYAFLDRNNSQRIYDLALSRKGEIHNL